MGAVRDGGAGAIDVTADVKRTAMAARLSCGEPVTGERFFNELALLTEEQVLNRLKSEVEDTPRDHELLTTQYDSYLRWREEQGDRTPITGRTFVRFIMTRPFWAPLRQSVSQQVKGIAKPPGSAMFWIADLLFSPKTRDEVFGQLVEDLRDEYFEALAGSRPRKASLVRARYFWRFLCAIVEIGGPSVGGLVRLLAKTERFMSW